MFSAIWLSAKAWLEQSWGMVGARLGHKTEIQEAWLGQDSGMASGAWLGQARLGQSWSTVGAQSSQGPLIAWDKLGAWFRLGHKTEIPVARLGQG